MFLNIIPIKNASRQYTAKQSEFYSKEKNKSTKTIFNLVEFYRNNQSHVPNNPSQKKRTCCLAAMQPHLLPILRKPDLAHRHTMMSSAW